MGKNVVCHQSKNKNNVGKCIELKCIQFLYARITNTSTDYTLRTRKIFMEAQLFNLNLSWLLLVNIINWKKICS